MDSVLRPRDIQARIRSGESPETVAAAAQTSIERIMTFASPVLAERAFVAQQAQKASVRRRTGDGAPGQLGAAVAERLASQHLDAEDVEWDAWRREDGRWTLVAEYEAQSGPERAEFVYDTAGRYVTAADEQSRWLVGERVTAEPGAGTPQLHLGDDAIELVTGRRPAPPLDVVPDAGSDVGSGVGPAAGAEPVLRRAPHPVDALLDRDEPQPEPQPDRAPVSPETPAARRTEAPTEPDEVTVDLTEPAAAARSGRGRSARPARPMADPDWMATQASERLAGAAAPAETRAPAEAPAETTTETPTETPAARPVAASPAPTAPPGPPAPVAEAEALFEVPEDTTDTSPAAEGDVPPPEKARTARPGKTTKSGKGRAAIPSWDEIMFGSSNAD